jgi:carlactone synthase/all-trans-10'-apo-beta-carotenal 13,14-cleaving dioxygenase
VSNVVVTLTGAALTDNPNSAVLPLGDGRVLCLTETTKSSSVLIDPDTLNTVGKFRYADKLGSMMIQSAHPITVTTGDEHDDELLTVLPDLAPRLGYLVVRMASGSNERKVIGRVYCRGGHSFAVTDRYVVVPEMPLRYSASSLVRSELAPYYAFDWLPASGSYMHQRRGASVHGHPLHQRVRGRRRRCRGHRRLLRALRRPRHHPHASPPQTQILLQQ